MKLTKEMLNNPLIDVKSDEIVDKLAEMDYKKYLATTYWKSVRKTMHEVVGYGCEICDSERKIYVHHLNYESRGRETLNDLVCLCGDCHEAIHSYHETIFTGYFVSNRKDFNEQIMIENKIRKYFGNEQFLKISPLTRKHAWEMKDLKSLYGCNEEEVRKMFDKEIKDKLIFKSTGSTGNSNFEFYTLNRFVWFMLELGFL